MSLSALKHAALTHEGTRAYTIRWEQLDADPTYKKIFEQNLYNAVRLLPTLESIYTKLTSGKSIILPDDTALPYDDVDQYTALLEEELVINYQLLDIYNRYHAVQDVINNV